MKRVMKSNNLKKLVLFTMASTYGFILKSQDLLDKLDQSQGEVGNKASQAVDTFFFFANILAAIVVASWAVQGFRAAKRSASEEGAEPFNVVSFASVKGGGLLFYVIIQVVAKSFV